MSLDTNANSEIIATVQREYKLLAEYKMIQSEDVGGVYVIPSHDCLLMWFGVIFVREGYYKDGIFRFNISFSSNFPDDKNPPTINFTRNVFHPLICKYTGDLDISDVAPEWVEGSTHVWQLLKFIQFIFIHPEECLSKTEYLNPKAAELLSQNKTEFLSNVDKDVQLSIAHVYDPPPTDDKHQIIFERYDEEVHGAALNSLRKQKDIFMSAQCSGLSWVKEGEFKPLTRE